jgi:hypothetical protein
MSDGGPPSLPAIRLHSVGSVSEGEPQINYPTKEIGLEARPKTLAEIKSRRRFSLSTMSHFARSSSPTSSSIVAMARPRPRPISTVSFNSRPTSYLVDENSFRSTRARGIPNISTMADREDVEIAPPLLRSSGQNFNTTASGFEEYRPRGATLAKKKERRLSLSALNFTRKQNRATMGV